MEAYSAIAFLILLDLLLFVVLSIQLRKERERYSLFFQIMIGIELLRQSTNLALTVYPTLILLPLSGILDTARGVALFLGVAALIGRKTSYYWLLVSIPIYALFLAAVILMKLELAVSWVVTFSPIAAIHIGATLLLARTWRKQSPAVRFLQTILFLHAPVLVLQTVTGVGEGTASAAAYFLDSVMIVLLAMAAIIVAMERLYQRLQLSTQAIVDSEERYRSVFDSAFDAIVSFDEAGMISELNPSAEAIFGWNRTDLLGRSFGDTLLASYSRRTFQQSCAEYFDLNDSSVLPRACEVVGQKRDGTPFPVELTLRPGRRDQNRTLNAFARDLTSAKEAEEERKILEAQMQHAQKLESLGILAGGIAHDFNNLLVGMLGFASLAKGHLPPESPAIKDIEEVEKAANRAADLTNQMLAYAGKGTLCLRAINLSEIVNDMGALIESTISRKADLKLLLDMGLPSVNGDPSQICQIILNLISNASDALTNESGTIRLCTGASEIEDDDLASTFIPHSGTKGLHVFIEVSDTGCGMDRETIARMFDPFYSTKFSGRGLGMAAVLGIVRRHNGTIRVHSEPKIGTTITVLIPCEPATDVAPVRGNETLGQDREDLDQWQGSGSILVADDEESVRELIARFLEAKGFDVITACDGQEAVELFQKHKDELCLVLLDLTMPRLGGLEAFDRMTKFEANVPILLSSGYNEATAHESFQSQEFAGFIQKPYAPGELIERVRAILTQQEDAVTSTASTH